MINFLEHYHSFNILKNPYLHFFSRFCFLLKTVIKTDKAQVKPQRDSLIARIENDTFILNLFTSLLVSIPQIILQIHVMSVLQQTSFWTSKYFSVSFILFIYNKIVSIIICIIGHVVVFSRTIRKKKKIKFINFKYA